MVKKVKNNQKQSSSIPEKTDTDSGDVGKNNYVDLGVVNLIEYVNTPQPTAENTVISQTPATGNYNDNFTLVNVVEQDQYSGISSSGEEIRILSKDGKIMLPPNFRIKFKLPIIIEHNVIVMTKLYKYIPGVETMALYDSNDEYCAIMWNTRDTRLFVDVKDLVYYVSQLSKPF